MLPPIGMDPYSKDLWVMVCDNCKKVVWLQCVVHEDYTEELRMLTLCCDAPAVSVVFHNPRRLGVITDITDA